MSGFVVMQDTPTEVVSKYFKGNPQVPGAIIIKDRHVYGIIPRNKMFERLGHRYGVELFLRKPIQEMEREIESDALVLKNHIPVNTAVKFALSRSQTQIYDPVIVEFEDGSVKLLDAYILLLSQSQLSQNLSGLVSSLNNIEMLLANDHLNPNSTLELTMESMERVIPSHHAHIILQTDIHLSEFSHPCLSHQSEMLSKNNVYRSVLTMNQPMVVEDVTLVPSWTNWETPRGTRSWLGAPVVSHKGPIGVLSLSRTVFSPFTNHEKEISQVFSRYLGKLFEIVSRQLKQRDQLKRKYETR